MKIQKTTTFSLECLTLEYALNAILIDNSPEAIEAAASYVLGCKRNSWKDRIINIDTLIEILAETGAEYKDIYDDEAYSKYLRAELEDNQIDIMSRNNVEKEKGIPTDSLHYYFDDEVFEALVGKFGLEKVKEALDDYDDAYGECGTDYLGTVEDPSEVMNMLNLDEDDLD
jgi:hypothetical protein